MSAFSRSPVSEISRSAAISRSRATVRMPRSTESAAAAPSAASPSAAIGSGAASSCRSSGADASRMLMRQPVSRAANREFCPSRPMASDTMSGATKTSARFSSTLMFTAMICAGLKALPTYRVASSLNSTISTFSGTRSRTTFWIRAPRTPTQEPTGSSPSWSARTATLVRIPASRAMLTISTALLAISGISRSKRRRTKSAWRRETSNCGPRPASFTCTR